MSNKYKCICRPQQPNCSKCDFGSIYMYSTQFFGIRLWYTAECIVCGKKAKGRTLYKAMEKFNRMIGESNE